MLIVTLLTLLGSVLWMAHSAVDNTVTANDRNAITPFLMRYGLSTVRARRDYRAEIAFIKGVQAGVLRSARGQRGIPLGASREPQDVLAAASGLCYDRSRVIEKVLRHAGFATRHVAIYSTLDTGSSLRALLTPQVTSHAVTEVLTRNGWLVVDSNAAWLSLDHQQSPVSTAQIAADVGRRAITWATQPGTMNGIFTEPFVYLFGLYSRHGRFYPPYNRLPDVHYGELADNLSRWL